MFASHAQYVIPCLGPGMEARRKYEMLKEVDARISEVRQIVLALSSGDRRRSNAVVSPADDAGVPVLPPWEEYVIQKFKQTLPICVLGMGAHFVILGVLDLLKSMGKKMDADVVFTRPSAESVAVVVVVTNENGNDTTAVSNCPVLIEAAGQCQSTVVVHIDATRRPDIVPLPSALVNGTVACQKLLGESPTVRLKGLPDQNQLAYAPETERVLLSYLMRGALPAPLSKETVLALQRAGASSQPFVQTPSVVGGPLTIYTSPLQEQVRSKSSDPTDQTQQAPGTSPAPTTWMEDVLQRRGPPNLGPQPRVRPVQGEDNVRAVSFMSFGTDTWAVDRLMERLRGSARNSGRKLLFTNPNPSATGFVVIQQNGAQRAQAINPQCRELFEQAQKCGQTFITYVDTEPFVDLVKMPLDLFLHVGTCKNLLNVSKKDILNIKGDPVQDRLEYTPELEQGLLERLDALPLRSLSKAQMKVMGARTRPFANVFRQTPLTMQGIGAKPGQLPPIGPSPKKPVAAALELLVDRLGAAGPPQPDSILGIGGGGGVGDGPGIPAIAAGAAGGPRAWGVPMLPPANAPAAANAANAANAGGGGPRAWGVPLQRPGNTANAGGGPKFWGAPPRRGPPNT